MQTRRNAVLDAALFMWMAVALVLVFFYAPIERQQGIVQKIFYFHVPLAWNGNLGFVASIPRLLQRGIRNRIYQRQLSGSNCQKGKWPDVV